MLYIIRHGQTEGNVAKQLQGRRDNPLNATGIEQAQAAGDKLRSAGVRFSSVYTSPLSRAMDTANIVSPGTRCIVDERLTEMDYGPYEGMSLTNPSAEVLAFFKDFANHPAPKGMEPLASVVSRMGAFLEDVHSVALREDILVSTHAIALKGALEYLTPNSNGNYWSTFIGNCAIYATTAHANGTWAIPREWNA